MHADGSDSIAIPFGVTLHMYETGEYIFVGDRRSKSVSRVPTTSDNGGADFLTSLKISFPKLEKVSRLVNKRRKDSGKFLNDQCCMSIVTVCMCYS